MDKLILGYFFFLKFKQFLNLFTTYTFIFKTETQAVQYASNYDKTAKESQLCWDGQNCPILSNMEL